MITKKIITSILLYLPVLLYAEEQLQLPITIVITSFNNKDWYKDNLDSAFNQNYQNYKILYIDDCSTDSTAQLVKQYTQERNQTHKLTLIENKEWRSQMANHYYAVHRCDDQDIIVHLDGDDKLAHPHVLSFVNSIYQDSNVWITFGKYSTFPGVQIPPRITQKQLAPLAHTNTFREHIAYKSFPFIHLRTFRAWLFKCIKLQDLIYQSSFASMSPAPDVAFMLPMLEMAGKHSRVIDRILYNYNLKNPLTQYTLNSQNVIKLVKTIVQWPKYTPLAAPQNNISTRYTRSKADVIILAHTASDTLLQSIEAFTNHVHNIHTIILLMPEQEKEKWYTLTPSLTTSMPTFKTRFYTNFKQELLDTLTYSMPHVVLNLSDTIITKTIDLNECIRELEKRHAYAFHLQLAYPGPQLDKLHALITQTVIAWQRDYMQDIWNPDHTTGAIVYRSRDIAQSIQKLKFNSLKKFKKLWRYHKLPARTVELSFK